GPGLVADGDAHVLKSRRRRDSELRKDLERVGQVDADVLLPGLDVDVGLEVARANDAHAPAPRREVRWCFALSEARGVSVVGDADGQSVVPIEDLVMVLELQGRAPILSARLRAAAPGLRVELKSPCEQIALRVDEANRGAPAEPQMQRAPAGREDLTSGSVVDAVDFRVAVQRLAGVVAVERVAGQQQRIRQPLT